MTVWTKDPDETADYSIDWAPELGEDVIVDSQWDDITTGITTGTPASTFTPTTTTIWISGGVAGTVYSLTNTITTLGGRTFDQEVELRVIPTPLAVPPYSGCLWPIDPACLTEAWESYDDTVRQRALALASATLYRLTGYRVGGCPITVRPVLQTGVCGLQPGSFEPYLWAGHWYNTRPLPDPRVVTLPRPVGEVEEVKVDGAVVAPADYVVTSDGIVWIGAGDPPWPRAQDVYTPDSEPGTMSVTYHQSYPVDSLGAYAAGLLTMEFASACASGGKKCRLPSNIVSIVRQGVSYELTAGAFPDGKTSIREVDAYIEQWNPTGRRPGVVFDALEPKVYVQR